MKIVPLAVPTPFYIGDVNVYLIKDAPLTLIDVGPKTVDAKTALREKLRDEGVKISDIKRIVLTHAHEDHCGLAKEIRDESNAEIFVHEWETGQLFGQAGRAEHKNLLTRAGVSDAVFEEIQTIYRDIARLTDQIEASEFSPLKDDAEIEFASGVLKILHAPGHTLGSCCFFREANRTLIAGDTVLKRVTPNPIIAPDPFDANKRFASLAEYLVSLARIRALSPTIVHGGHGEPIFDFEEIFNRYVRAIEDRQRKIIASIPASGATAFEIARKIFPDAFGKNVHTFLAISETVAHLDFAQSEGKIAVELNDGAEFYRKT